jgi:hypothetical protein
LFAPGALMEPIAAQPRSIVGTVTLTGGNRADFAWIYPRRGAYEYDSSTGRAPNGLSADAAGGRAPMVNWGVVSGDWSNLQNEVRGKTEALKQKLTAHTG